MENNEYVNRPTKIFDLTDVQIAELLHNCFFIVGKKFNPSAQELTVFIQNVLKYQSNVRVDEFQEAFEMWKEGTLRPDKLYLTVTPIFIGMLIKAYKENKYGVDERVFTPKYDTKEGAFRMFFAKLKTYGILEAPGHDWISVYNYCLSQDWITGQPEIPAWSVQSHRFAEKAVKELAVEKWSEFIHDGCKFKGGSNRLEGLGEKIRKSYEV